MLPQYTFVKETVELFFRHCHIINKSPPSLLSPERMVALLPPVTHIGGVNVGSRVIHSLCIARPFVKALRDHPSL